LLTAYVLAQVEAGKDEEVLSEAKRMSGVKKIVSTYGTYDLHIEVAFDSMEQLDNFVFDEIRLLDGIKETVTLIASEETHTRTKD
jgi:DNA-binding Lrp family transcriptional regulator